MRETSRSRGSTGWQNALGGKFFAETAEDAARWREKLEGKGNFRIIDAQIPTVKANEFMRREKFDGIGPSLCRVATVERC
jgi:hypothetical protein